MHLGKLPPHLPPIATASNVEVLKNYERPGGVVALGTKDKGLRHPDSLCFVHRLHAGKLSGQHLLVGAVIALRRAKRVV